MDLHAKDSDSRVEKILSATLGNYDKPLPRPQSRVEEYLMAIKDQGGGGGGTTDYNQLINKPTLNGKTLEGDLSSADVGVASNGSHNSYNADGEGVIIGGGGNGNTYDPNSESVVIGGL